MEEKCRWSLLGVSLLLLVSPSNADLDQSHPLRFWMDEYAFSRGETTILRERIQDAGLGVANVSGESFGAHLSEKGYYYPDQWDVYWTGRQGCTMALPHVVPGHKVSCVPGLHELTLKDRLVARLTQFYGEGAFRIVPRSYLLPAQYWSWRMWLASKARKERGELWVLKKEVHRGKGVHVLPLQTAIQNAKKSEEKFDLVQRYISNQMTVLGRRFYIRLWAVVTSSFPLRAYLYDGGVVVFGNTTPDEKAKMTSDDYIVNLWHLGRTTEARPWSVAEFKTYLDNLTGSRQTYDDLWREMRRSLGLAFAAGVQSMRFSAAQFPVAAASATFEMVGIDFLVDENMKPWLLEINAVPSMARKVIDCAEQPEGCAGGGEAESVFDVEKERFVGGLFNLLRATAGVNVSEQAKLMENKPTSLAAFLKKWKTNETDLELLKQSNQGNKSKVHAELGWGSTGDDQPEPKKASAKGLDLQNSGRELRQAKNVSQPPFSVRVPLIHYDNTQQESDGLERVGKAQGFQKRLPDDEAVKEDQPATEPTGDNVPLRQGDRGGKEENVASGPASPLHRASRAQTVGDATNLNKYVEKSTPRLDPATKEEQDRILEEHLMAVSVKELDVAIANHFLPLMMIPEAVDYSLHHQSRGHVHPLPAHKMSQPANEQQSILSALLTPFRPMLGAYGGIADMLERLRVGFVALAPDVNTEVTIGMARNTPGADWVILQFYRLFSYGDRRGTVEAFSVLPKHRLDQRLSDYIKTLPSES